MPADRLTQAVPFQFIKSVKKFSTKVFSMLLRAFSCCSFIKVAFDFLVIKHDSRDTDQYFRDRKCKPGKAQVNQRQQPENRNPAAALAPHGHTEADLSISDRLEEDRGHQ